VIEKIVQDGPPLALYVYGRRIDDVPGLILSSVS